MILCCGEALIDMLPVELPDGATAYRPHPGGAIFNTAIALGRLGRSCALLTGLSSDLFGEMLEAALKASAVDTSLAVRTTRPTTLAFVRLEGGHASYSFFDENSATRMLRPGDLPALPDSVSALYFGGISLAAEPGADTFAALLEGEGARRAVMIDPNIRPAFIADADRYRARLFAMLGRADIVKTSDEDLDWIDPSQRPLEAKVAALLAAGPAVVIVTRGSAGATGHLRDGTAVEVPAARVKVVDTVGAGDTFNAGVLARLAEMGALSKDRLASLDAATLCAALEHGARVAAVTVSRAGANPPWAHELAGGTPAA